MANLVPQHAGDEKVVSALREIVRPLLSPMQHTEYSNSFPGLVIGRDVRRPDNDELAGSGNTARPAAAGEVAETAGRSHNSLIDG